MKKTAIIVALFMSLAGGAVVLLAQQTNVGNLTGSVTDPSGAIVPGAKVSAVNTATSVARSTVVTSGGVYFINVLDVGRYTVTVTQNGFRTEVSNNVAVLAAETTTVNFVLQVGATTQTVTVTGAPPG